MLEPIRTGSVTESSPGNTSRRAQRKTAPGRGPRPGAVLVEDSGDDRLSRQRHYHGPDGLNGRVRNGNGCGPAGVVAGKASAGPVDPASAVPCGPAPGKPLCRVVVSFIPRRRDPRTSRDRHQSGLLLLLHLTRAVVGGESGWSSRSAVGTGPLRRSPAVHARPIDLVVFQEPSSA